MFGRWRAASAPGNLVDWVAEELAAVRLEERAVLATRLRDRCRDLARGTTRLPLDPVQAAIAVLDALAGEIDPGEATS